MHFIKLAHCPSDSSSEPFQPAMEEPPKRGLTHWPKGAARETVISNDCFLSSEKDITLSLMTGIAGSPPWFFFSLNPYIHPRSTSQVHLKPVYLFPSPLPLLWTTVKLLSTLPYTPEKPPNWSTHFPSWILAQCWLPSRFILLFLGSWNMAIHSETSYSRPPPHTHTLTSSRPAHTHSGSYIDYMAICLLAKCEWKWCTQISISCVAK